MVSTQATQTGKSPHPRQGDDSVRITAEIRRQVLCEHYTERLAVQQAAVASERTDRNALGRQEPVFSMADVRVSNKIAVLQDIAATLAAFGDNCDFGAVSA